MIYIKYLNLKLLGYSNEYPSLHVGDECKIKVRHNKPEKANKSGYKGHSLGLSGLKSLTKRKAQAAGDGLLVLPILPKIRAAQSWAQ